MSVFSIVLGILGIVAAFIAPILGGWIGGAIAIILGVGAIILGFLARKKSGKGMGGIVTGVLAGVAAVAMIFTTQSMMQTIKDKLLKELDKQDSSKYSVVAKYADQADTNTGFLGFVYGMTAKVTDEDKPLFEEQVKQLADLLSEKESTDSSAK